MGTIPSESVLRPGRKFCEPASGRSRRPQAKAVTRSARRPTQSYRVIYNFTGAADGGISARGLGDRRCGQSLRRRPTAVARPEEARCSSLTPCACWLAVQPLVFVLRRERQRPRQRSRARRRWPALRHNLGAEAWRRCRRALRPISRRQQSCRASLATGWRPCCTASPAGSDGANPWWQGLVLDSSGNIYGNAATAGANREGTLYEFTDGGIQVLHAFPAFPNDGLNPAGVVSGSNGLYGVTGSGGQYGGGSFYTTAGGYQVLHSFMPNYPGFPTSLTVDQGGNLYGASSYTYYTCIAPGGYGPVGNAQIFQVSPPAWNPAILISLQTLFVSLSARISTDASGNIYGTTDYYGFRGNVFKLTCCWNYTDLHYFAGGPNDGQQPEASPVVDAQGNIYGTTSLGGAYGQGVVWEISP